MQKPNIAVGSKVRSYDFPSRDKSRPECYVEGFVTQIIDGDRAVIHVVKEVWEGVEDVKLSRLVVEASLEPHYITGVYGVILA